MIECFALAAVLHDTIDYDRRIIPGPGAVSAFLDLLGQDIPVPLGALVFVGKDNGVYEMRYYDLLGCEVGNNDIDKGLMTTLLRLVSTEA